METQLRRGMLEICVLAAIKNKDSYGYKIIKDLKPVLELSESTLYSILKRLEESKMLIVKSVEHNGRLRKYYRITDLGIERIEEFKEEWEEMVKIYSFIVGEDK
ncbi:MAG: helix-turn-helix transcriptional regulator [Erysipelotrichaceae bacterium]|jgi:PadR family transcriptional regulator PadR|nr:PadR family transcriptional regulator [Bacillota bacterium]MDY0118380.1 PadR family transcriptional regulator [Bacilli bacterium]NLJ32701.1 helix-turn-helix transcriptional regulator [Erysipelotrichaceae bacterium]